MLSSDKTPRVAIVFGAVGFLLGLIALFLCAVIEAYGFGDFYCMYGLIYHAEAQRLGIDCSKLVAEGVNLALLKYALENGLLFIFIPTSISYLCGFLFAAETRRN